MLIQKRRLRFISIILALTLLSFLFLLNPLNSYAALQDKDYTMNYLEGDSLYNFLADFDVSVSYRTNTTEVFEMDPSQFTVLYSKFDDPDLNNDVYPPSTCVAIGLNNDFRNYLDVISWHFTFTPKFEVEIFGFMMDSHVTYALWNESGIDTNFFDISYANVTYSYTDGVTLKDRVHSSSVSNIDYHSYPVPQYSYDLPGAGPFGLLSGFSSNTMHLRSVGVGIHELKLLEPDYIVPYTFTGFSQNVGYSGEYDTGNNPGDYTYNAYNICYLLDISSMTLAVPSSEYNEAIALYRILVDLNLPLPSKDELLSGNVDFLELIGRDIDKFNKANDDLQDGFGNSKISDINGNYFDVMSPTLTGGLENIVAGLDPVYDNPVFTIVFSSGFVVCVAGYILFGKRGA